MNFLLQFLNLTILTTKMWQLQELNAILEAAENQSEIRTVTFFGDLFDIETFITVLEKNTVPKLVITQNYGDINFIQDAALNKEIFFVAKASLDRKSLWNHLNNAFRGIQGHVRGVFVTTRPRGKNARLNLRQHFEWCWQKGFTNALILVDNENIYQQQFEIYNYNHFQQSKVINMSLLSKQALYPDKFRNLYKFKIRTAAYFDPPRIFKAVNSFAKYKDHLMGYVALLFQAFLREYNADMDILYFDKNKSENILDIIQRIENNIIDLSLNPYVPYKNVYLSYPLHMLQRCVIVPFPNEIPKYKVFILPFQTEVWLVFMATWFILSVAKLFAWSFKHRKLLNEATDVGKTFLDVWRLMMYLPTSASSCYRDLKWFNALWFTFVAVMGFIFSNLYMASLTSFFAGVTFKPAIDTLDELIERRVNIHAIDYEISTIINNRDLPNAFAELLQARNNADMLNDIIEMKPNYSYADLEDRIQFTFSQQTHLLQPISHKVKESLSTMPFGLLLPRHSQFEKPLNRFILRSTAAGLMGKWISDSIQDGYRSGILIMRTAKLDISRPLTLKHFQFGWYVLAGGYILGFVVLLLENLKTMLKRFKLVIVYY